MKLGARTAANVRTSGPSSDHEKINFYGRIAIFMKLGLTAKSAHKRCPSSDHEKINF